MDNKFPSKNFQSHTFKQLSLSLLAILLLGSCASFYGKSGNEQGPGIPSDPLVETITSKVKNTVKVLGDSVVYPRNTAPDGRWVTVPIRSWTSGFFPGILWYMDELSGDKSFRNYADRWTQGLEPLQFYRGSHDIGFMVYCSYGNGYRITKNETYKKVILQTAQTLTTRYNPMVGCIKSWDNRKWAYPVIIDNMMNLELLFWASKNGGTQQMHDIALSHAEKTMKNHFREDGSTYHVLSYDTLNGSVISKGTHQGYADESCWSRGQAWAIYGFTMSYRFTKDERFLQTAQKAADYFLAHLPSDNVPYWDFTAASLADQPRDASAGAIASSALFELSTYGNDPALHKKYIDGARSILRSLSSSPYFNKDEGSQGLLLHSVGNKPSNSEIDVTLIYGDYYFLEALLRSRDVENQFVRK